MFADDDHWRDWAMLALATASDYWGGGGFILVPYDRASGEPSPHFREVVRSYDPDHIVTLEVGATQMDEWYPGYIQISGVKDEAEHARLVRTIHGGVDDANGLRARSLVASWCSPFRSIRLTRDADTRQRETITKLGRADRSDRYRRGLTVAPLPSSTSRVAASASWRSDVGLAAAAKVGVADSESTERGEPELDSIGWMTKPFGEPPVSLLWTTAEPSQTTDEPDWWFRANQGLIQVSRSFTRDKGSVVVGDTGTDFALALAYDRILGRGVWLPSAVLGSADIMRRQVRPAVQSLIADLQQDASSLVVCSTSVPARKVARISESLQKHEYGFETEVDRETVQLRFADTGRSPLFYVVDDHVGASVFLPMAQDEDGTLNALTGLETPIPSELMYSVGSGKVPYWYVEVGMSGDHAPRARDIPASRLTIESGTFPEVQLRASADGVTFDPSSMGFVPGGSLLPGRIGRPRLRSLSLRAWVEGMAAAEGLGVRLSTPGRQAELVRRRIGSRRDLLDLVAGPSLSMLRAFIPYERRPDSRDPDTVVLGLDPYLSFGGIKNLLLDSEERTIEVIDVLTSARLLRRGLILNCSECGRPSFLDADRLGQQYECPQCATMNTLTSDRWRLGSEPRWFFDLYATFRELLASHGDVPILASAALSQRARGYLDTPELEFFELDGGKTVAEIDVISSVNGEVIVVEAKSSNEFSRGKRVDQVKKLLRIAEVLRADRIVLATLQDSWKPGDVEHLAKEAAKSAPFPLHTEVLAALGR
ncbi:hypothetical protein Q5716_06055 [Protaetiibacter sp. WY-16]|uniref:Uncharacterized protein n=2 Tax=Antiquaquibacter soli TaxID=3064523 RepID=A0ABT9BL92_9MICO|nr:hypothetical protein [Protaetiibacter sp. WY-16]